MLIVENSHHMRVLNMFSLIPDKTTSTIFRAYFLKKTNSVRKVFWARTCVWHGGDVSPLGQLGTAGHRWSFICGRWRIFLTKIKRNANSPGLKQQGGEEGNMCQGEIFGRDPDHLVAKVPRTPRAFQGSSRVSGCTQTPSSRCQPHAQTPHSFPPFHSSPPLCASIKFHPTPPSAKWCQLNLWICSWYLMILFSHNHPGPGSGPDRCMTTSAW